MSLKERYLEDVQRNVYAPPEARDQFLSDLRMHIEEAVARGESEAQAIGKLGLAEDVAAEFMTAFELRPAGFWVRTLAFTIDISVLLAVMIIIPAILFLPLVLMQLEPGKPLLDAMKFSIDGGSILGIIALMMGITWIAVYSLTVLLYFPLGEKLYGTTFGKRLLKLRVVKEGGGAIGYGAAFLRRLSFFLEILVIDALFIPFNQKKQRAFDMVAKTQVIFEPWQKTPGWMIAVVIASLLIPVMIGLLVMGLIAYYGPM